MAPDRRFAGGSAPLQISMDAIHNQAEDRARLAARNDIITVLLADDDEDDQMMTADALKSANVASRLHCVADGEELMDYLRHRGKYAFPAPSPRPGILLLDLNMPKKDGREALREIKADPELRTIPVVILTTSKTEEDIERIYGLGANSYISKPVSFEGLVHVMKVMNEYWFQIVRLPRGI